jgi:hypothetical protein
MAKRVYIGLRSEPALITLLGISCHLRDYRLSHMFSQHLGFSFIKRDELKIRVSADQESEFSFYTCRDEEHQNLFYLVANRAQSAILIPEMKQFDFILFVEGKFNKPEKEFMMKTLRAVAGILTVFEMQIQDIKNPEILLTDIEMHLMNIHKVPKTKYEPKNN